MTTEPATPTDTGESPKRGSVGGNARGGSAGMVLVVALALVGAAVGLMFVGRANTGNYILALLATLSTVGVFSLFALASGIIRFAGKNTGDPTIRAVVDNAFDGIVVTDAGGRVHLCQRRLSRRWSMPSMQRTCGRWNACSSATRMCRKRSIAC